MCRADLIHDMGHEHEYSSFDQLDGQHPWKDAVPEGYVSYPVRQLAGGKVIYFNFQLAKEMGLVHKDHPEKINKPLEQKILQAFNIRIINEFDQDKKIQYDPKTIRENRYMATRYLQLQHTDKTGKTSGDGRCVWNGVVKHGGQTWDVNSRGTGVTKLAPGAVEAELAGHFIRSGSFEFGYGCGTAEVDELLGASILSEIFYNTGLESERVLAVIDNGRGQGIGVRAGTNLLRPAHIFLYLKQSQPEALKRSMDYFIDRQFSNGAYSVSPRSSQRYPQLLTELADRFAKFAAMLEREYIFAWLDWDGDNVLMQPGIIDYGSVRQFGLRHDQYRYDDAERWSTNLNEQRAKAAGTVQTFAQLTDYLKTGKKKSLSRFRKHQSVAHFHKRFDHYLQDYLLFQAGFNSQQRKIIFRFFPQQLKKMYSAYNSLERQKTKVKTRRVADGVNRPAIFNMRKMLWRLPEFYTSQPEVISWMPENDFFEEMLASSASKRDKKMDRLTRKKIFQFQSNYQDLLLRVTGLEKNRGKIKTVASRSRNANPAERITGNALIFIVEEILKFRKKGLVEVDVQSLIVQLINLHSPVKKRPLSAKLKWKNPEVAEKLYKKVASIISNYSEEI